MSDKNKLAILVVGFVAVVGMIAYHLFTEGSFLFSEKKPDNKITITETEEKEDENLMSMASRIKTAMDRRSDGTFRVHTIEDWTVETDLIISGPVPEKGILVINENDEVALALYDSGYCAVKGFLGEITVSESDGTCTHEDITEHQEENNLEEE